ncbi:MAG: sugar phosphate isomerase/epimerase [Bacteroidales bacterium]|jgi:sugar phosphate isomerase/epimerase
MKEPAVYLAQFMGDEPPFNNLENICKYMANLGYKGVQIPTFDPRCVDLKKLAESQTYADEIKGIVNDAGCEITELATHIQGQLVAVNPAFNKVFDSFAPPEYQNNPEARTEWAVNQMKLAAQASKNLGITEHVTFSGNYMWHTMYPFPPRPAGLIDTGFKALAEQWKPILDAFDEAGVDLCFELHPCEDLHDGVTYEKFLEATNNHPRVNIMYDPSHFVLQQLNYLEFIDIYHEKIKMFHVKDAEFKPNGRSGMYGGYQDWVNRPARFRSLGDGDVDFKGIFSKLAQYDFEGWPVLEWECALKNPEDGAAEGAPFIAKHIIRKSEKSFEDFAGGGGGADEKLNRRLLGLE